MAGKRMKRMDGKRKITMSLGPLRRSPRRKWAELDTDCLAKVFELVGTESLIFSIPFVCKSWNKVLCNGACWRRLLFPDDEEVLEENPELERLVNVTSRKGYPYSPKSKHNRFEHFLRRYERVFGHKRSKFTSLQFIKKVINFSCGEAQILKLPPYCRDEEYDDLLCDNIYYMKEILEYITNNCKNFYGLHISFAVLVSFNVTTLLEHMPTITHLSLRYLRITRKNLVRLLKGCKHLNYLDLSHCGAFDEGDTEIRKLTSKVGTFICDGASIVEEYFSDSEMENTFNMAESDDDESGKESDDDESGKESDDDESESDDEEEADDDEA